MSILSILIKGQDSRFYLVGLSICFSIYLSIVHHCVPIFYQNKSHCLKASLNWEIKNYNKKGSPCSECDRELTPWCNCTGAPPDTQPIDRWASILVTLSWSANQRLASWSRYYSRPITGPGTRTWWYPSFPKRRKQKSDGFTSAVTWTFHVRWLSEFPGIHSRHKFV